MPDETESAVAAWLDDASTRREIAIAQSRLSLQQARPASYVEAVMLALGIELLAALNIYGDPTSLDNIENIADPSTLDLEDEDDEPWKRG